MWGLIPPLCSPLGDGRSWRSVSQMEVEGVTVPKCKDTSLGYSRPARDVSRGPRSLSTRTLRHTRRDEVTTSGGLRHLPPYPPTPSSRWCTKGLRTPQADVVLFVPTLIHSDVFIKESLGPLLLDERFLQVLRIKDKPWIPVSCQNSSQ